MSTERLARSGLGDEGMSALELELGQVGLELQMSASRAERRRKSSHLLASVFPFSSRRPRD